MTTRRSAARAFYLELCALGIDLRTGAVPELRLSCAEIVGLMRRLRQSREELREVLADGDGAVRRERRQPTRAELARITSGRPVVRSAGTFEAEGEDGLRDSERKSLRALEAFGEVGAKASEWQRKAEKLDVKRRSFYNALNELKRKELVLQEKHRYYPSSANECNGGAMHKNAPGPDASATGAAAFKRLV